MSAINFIIAGKGIQLFYAGYKLGIATRRQVAATYAPKKQCVAGEKAVFGKIAYPARSVPGRGNHFEIYARNGYRLPAAKSF